MELTPGVKLGPTDWLEVDQQRIDRFAAATDDPQWIHVDPARAAEGPFGTTIAHGFLTLALLVPFWYEVAPPPELGGYRFALNYGVNRVRFPGPLPVGSRVRARFEVADLTPVESGLQATITATVEREGFEKPVCAAELVFRFLR